MTNKNKLIMVFYIIILLVSFGCAQEPSELEMKTAIQNQYKELLAPAGGLISDDLLDNLLPKIKEVKKINCVKASDKGGFNCDVEIVIYSPLTGENKQTQNIRFIKTDTGWRVSN